jgi:hypothetical protein
MSDDKEYLRGLKLLVKPIMRWRDFLYYSTAIFMLLLRMRRKYQKTHDTLVGARQKVPAHGQEFGTMHDDWISLQKYMRVKIGDTLGDFFFSFDFSNADEATNHFLTELDSLNDEIEARMDEYAERIEKLAG